MLFSSKYNSIGCYHYCCSCFLACQEIVLPGMEMKENASRDLNYQIL